MFVNFRWALLCSYFLKSSECQGYLLINKRKKNNDMKLSQKFKCHDVNKIMDIGIWYDDQNLHTNSCNFFKTKVGLSITFLKKFNTITRKKEILFLKYLQFILEVKVTTTMCHFPEETSKHTERKYSEFKHKSDLYYHNFFAENFPKLFVYLLNIIMKVVQLIKFIFWMLSILKIEGFCLFDWINLLTEYPFIKNSNFKIYWILYTYMKI